MKEPTDRSMRRSAVFVLAVLLAASAARAQPQSETSAIQRPPGDMLTALTQKTKLGDTLRVLVNDGTERKGILTDVSVTSVTLMISGRREEVPEAATRRILRENPDSLRNGARNGAIVGGVTIAALLLPQALHPEPRYVDAPTALVATGFYVGIGVAVGVGIDALIKDHTLVYDRPAAPQAPIVLAPLLAQHETGLRIAVVW